MFKRRMGAIGAVVVLSVAGCGNDSDDDASAPEARVIEVSMTDNAFTPSSFEFEQGDFVIFRFTNNGTVDHEAVVGDEMFQMGHMDHQHQPGETMPGSVVIAPGAQADLPYVFELPGQLLIGCHVDGHWESGMKATIEIAPS